MNRELRRKRERADAKAQIEALREQVQGLTQAKFELLDLLNALLRHAGGRAEIPMSLVLQAKSRPVTVNVRPPDPEAAGDEGALIVQLEGDEPQPSDEAIRRRLQERGLWLPKGETP